MERKTRKKAMLGIPLQEKAQLEKYLLETAKIL
jgi:hypothetical protein